MKEKFLHPLFLVNHSMQAQLDSQGFLGCNWSFIVLFQMEERMNLLSKIMGKSVNRHYTSALCLQGDTTFKLLDWGEAKWCSVPMPPVAVSENYLNNSEY